ncbi:uncharacterized protein LOC128774867 isoform X1 [Panthera pardus]|uniref:Uncharacterized protein LOC128774867 isoform X1 n=2 Tax=Panthera pardus TaxID=9691 RepID=A0A9W2UW50_PANPR|nr:uncharacterized protein LOC128774867 isoform X1 [Panthera pardus]
MRETRPLQTSVTVSGDTPEGPGTLSPSTEEPVQGLLLLQGSSNQGLCPQGQQDHRFWCPEGRQPSGIWRALEMPGTVRTPRPRPKSTVMAIPSEAGPGTRGSLVHRRRPPCRPPSLRATSCQERTDDSITCMDLPSYKVIKFFVLQLPRSQEVISQHELSPWEFGKAGQGSAAQPPGEASQRAVGGYRKLKIARDSCDFCWTVNFTVNKEL